MGRTRKIKPEFFEHFGLFQAERDSGLPLRVAFAALWTCADREGRFRWRPEELKLDCLPYDDVDMARVLDALATYGFIVRYSDGNEVFGHIPSWKKHQPINQHEARSALPDPSSITDMHVHARARTCNDMQRICVHVHASEREREKGAPKREREPYLFSLDGFQRDSESVVDSGSQRDSESLPENNRETAKPEPRTNAAKAKFGPAKFDEFWAAYPDKVAKGAAQKAFVKAGQSGEVEFDDLMAGLARYKRNKPDWKNWCNPATWLNAKRWLDEYDKSANGKTIWMQTA